MSSTRAALEAFDELAGCVALAVLAVAPTPTAGKLLSRSKIAGALRRGGRQRRIDERAVEIQTALRTEQLQAPTLVADAMGATVAAFVAVIAEMQIQIGRLETELADRFEQHPNATFFAEFLVPGDPPAELEAIVVGDPTGSDAQFYEPTVLPAIPPL